MKRLFPLILALLFLPLSIIMAAGQSVDVTGDWEFTLNAPTGSRQLKATLKQEGEKLTGVFKNERGEVPCQGTVKDKEIKLTYTIKFQDQDLQVTFTGKVDGDSMAGKADFGGFAEGDWSAKRQAKGGTTDKQK